MIKGNSFSYPTNKANKQFPTPILRVLKGQIQVLKAVQNGTTNQKPNHRTENSVIILDSNITDNITKLNFYIAEK